MCKINSIVPTFSTVIQTSNSLNLCVRCTGSKSFCWKCFCVCVMYWPYKSFCLKCFCMCVWCTGRAGRAGPIKVFVGNDFVCVWCTGAKKFLLEMFLFVMYWPKKFLLEMFLCVWCIGPIKVFFLSKCFSVCVMYGPFKSYCFECFFFVCVCVYIWCSFQLVSVIITIYQIFIYLFI